MAASSDQTPERYFYRAAMSSRRHRHRVSVYLVEYLRGSKVVARIEPMGLVHESLGEPDLVIQGLRRNLVLTGTWHHTQSQHHDRVRVSTL
ncbi:MAG: hypothetical protein ABSG24_08705 [Acidimicrobiales bacterium]|jgi:hypothetical protein